MTYVPVVAFLHLFSQKDYPIHTDCFHSFHSKHTSTALLATTHRRKLLDHGTVGDILAIKREI